MNLRREIIRKKIHVGVALDESGSMLETKKETLNGINEQIQELKKQKEVETTFTLVTFSGPNDVKTIRLVEPIENIKDIKDSEYKPDGMTALYDGVARLFSELKQNTVEDEHTSYLILVVSDGQENSSVEYNANKIAEMVTERKNSNKWTISYIGANQDLSIVKNNLKIEGFNWIQTADGTNSAWNTIRNASVKYCSAVANGTSAPETYYTAMRTQNDSSKNNS